MLELLTELLKLINSLEGQSLGDEDLIRMRLMLDSVIRRHRDLYEVCVLFMNKMEDNTNEKSINSAARTHFKRLLEIIDDKNVNNRKGRERPGNLFQHNNYRKR